MRKEDQKLRSTHNNMHIKKSRIEINASDIHIKRTRIEIKTHSHTHFKKKQNEDKNTYPHTYKKDQN